MSNLGSSERPLRAAIVGSGPSGFYAAAALLNSSHKVLVDMFERLPAPFGLVRYGVAPDHPKIKGVTAVYEKLADRKEFAFFGNVRVGKDISLSELRNFYDVVIVTCGAETDKKLGIPGENLAASYTATEFVAWYNGHPDYQDRTFDLNHEAAVIMGQGNVAMDVARILCKTVDELKNTDITQTALETLAQSRLKKIYVVGRRGPVQAAFTPVTIKEFEELADCHTQIDPKEMELNAASQAELNDPANNTNRKNFEILKHLMTLPPDQKRRQCPIRFFLTPQEIQGQGKVERVLFEKGRLIGEPNKQTVEGTGEKETIGCGVFFRSIGYRGVPIPGFPFDDKKGLIPNKGGRVSEGEQLVPGLYVSGWIKRGPTGIIGTNKQDSEETVRNILEDIGNLSPCATPDRGEVVKFLKSKGLRFVTWADWKKIDAAEIERGKKIGKPREKFTSIADMLNVI